MYREYNNKYNIYCTNTYLEAVMILGRQTCSGVRLHRHEPENASLIARRECGFGLDLSACADPLCTLPLPSAVSFASGKAQYAKHDSMRP